MSREDAASLLLTCARQCVRVGMVPLGTAWVFRIHVRASDWIVTMRQAGTVG